MDGGLSTSDLDLSDVTYALKCMAAMALPIADYVDTFLLPWYSRPPV